jgi:hypothetical protein
MAGGSARRYHPVARRYCPPRKMWQRDQVVPSALEPDRAVLPATRAGGW